MDNFQGVRGRDAAAAAPEDEPSIERPPEIGVDERRMHVRAYNYWVSLLDGRAYPSIQDVDPHDDRAISGRTACCSISRAIPRIPRSPFSAARCASNAGSTPAIRRISEVPSRSLLSRLTDHYLQIIANRAPIGFEAEFVGQRGHNTLYRGILMPLLVGRRGDRLHLRRDQLEGDGGRRHRRRDRRPRSRRAIAARRAPALVGADGPVWADGPNADFVDASGDLPEPPATSSTLSLWPDAGLADRLCAARDCAEEAAGADQRGRHALYRALGHAYDFALAAAAGAGRLCRIARRCRAEGPGARADDADRQARLRRPLRQDPPHRIRRRPVLGAARGRRRRRARRADRKP